MKSVFGGFREFVMRGNAIELAVGVVIGAAFTAFVTSIVTYLINPIVGAIFGKPNFDQLWDITLRHGTKTVDGHVVADNATLSVGHILTALVQFLIVAVAVYFVIVLPMNRLNERLARRKEVVPQAPTADVQLLTEIRDLIAAGQQPVGPSASSR
jgi:large conductance mechanosensitive channel